MRVRTRIVRSFQQNPYGFLIKSVLEGAPIRFAPGSRADLRFRAYTVQFFYESCGCVLLVVALRLGRWTAADRECAYLDYRACGHRS